MLLVLLAAEGSGSWFPLGAPAPFPAGGSVPGSAPVSNNISNNTLLAEAVGVRGTLHLLAPLVPPCRVGRPQPFRGALERTNQIKRPLVRRETIREQPIKGRRTRRRGPGGGRLAPAKGLAMPLPPGCGQRQDRADRLRNRGREQPRVRAWQGEVETRPAGLRHPFPSSCVPPAFPGLPRKPPLQRRPEPGGAAASPGSRAGGRAPARLPPLRSRRGRFYRVSGPPKTALLQLRSEPPGLSRQRPRSRPRRAGLPARGRSAGEVSFEVSRARRYFQCQ